MAKRKYGKLFIFEGIDHVGKTTIVSEVSKALTDESIAHSVYSFPGKESRTLGGLVYDFHHNTDRYIDYEINNISLQLLHVASHIDLLQRRIIPDLKNGMIVLLDRSWWSTYAYGLANGISKKELKLILAPELSITKSIPSKKFFLIERKQKSNDYKPEITHRILAAYEELKTQHPSDETVSIIENNSSILKAVTEIVIEIESAIGKPESALAHEQMDLFSQKKTSKHERVDRKIVNWQKNPISSSIYDTYWKFAAKRQDVFFAKINNTPAMLPADEILSKHKFTNAYRASDRVSQYLIRNVIYGDGIFSPEDMIFRIILFKLFNKIETWEILQHSFGEITYKDYNFEKYDKVLTEQLENNNRIYSAAYIMPSGKSAFHHSKKHQNNLSLLELMLKDGLASKVANAHTLEELYNALLSYPSLGRFLAFQLSIDINYSELCNFSEMSFVVAGPGAQSGIKKCFSSVGNYTDEEIIRYMAEKQQEEFERLGLRFQSLWGRPLQLIDCQNLFCETDKYSRVAFPNISGEFGRTRIKQLYKPSAKGPIEYFYPPKWGINQNIQRR